MQEAKRREDAIAAKRKDMEARNAVGTNSNVDLEEQISDLEM